MGTQMKPEEIRLDTFIIFPKDKKLFFLIRKGNLGIKLNPEFQSWYGFSEQELLKNPRIIFANRFVAETNFMVNLKNDTIELPTRDQIDSFKKSMENKFPAMKRKAFLDLEKEMGRIKEFIFSI